METKEFYIEDKGIPLHIKLDAPEENGTFPLLLLFHGFTGHMEEPHLLALKDAALRAGYAVLRADLYGHGKSGGEFRDHTILNWMENAECITAYAEQLPVNGKPVLCGHSQGGLLALMLAGKHPDAYRALLLLSPGISIPEDMKGGILLGERFDPEHIPDVITTWEDLELSGNYIRTMREIDPYEAARNYPHRTRIIHGSADEVIPVDYAKRIAGEFPDAELVLIEGDDHCFDLHTDQMASAAEDFLRSCAS